MARASFVSQRGADGAPSRGLGSRAFSRYGRVSPLSTRSAVGSGGGPGLTGAIVASAETKRPWRWCPPAAHRSPIIALGGGTPPLRPRSALPRPPVACLRHIARRSPSGACSTRASTTSGGLLLRLSFVTCATQRLEVGQRVRPSLAAWHDVIHLGGLPAAPPAAVSVAPQRPVAEDPPVRRQVSPGTSAGRMGPPDFAWGPRRPPGNRSDEARAPSGALQVSRAAACACRPSSSASAARRVPRRVRGRRSARGAGRCSSGSSASPLVAYRPRAAASRIRSLTTMCGPHVGPT